MEAFKDQLEEFCKSIATVIEFFLVIGVNKDAIEEQKDLIPCILSQFPPFPRNELQIPESIPIFCFPWGMHISKAVEEPSVSYMLLTDEKGNKLYCTSLKIWEQYEDPLSQLHSSGESKKRYSIYSDMDFYLPKCLVIVSRISFFETFERILRTIHKLSLDQVPIHIEWIISHMCLLIPTPPRGHVKVEYKLDELDFEFKLPPLNKLPLLDMNLGTIFTCLTLDNVLKVFTCIALENSVVFLSCDDFRLSACSLSLLSLLFPFQWSLVCVPILPEILLDYLYSPVSYVYGVNIRLKDEVCIRGNETLFLVDLDNNSVQSNAQAMKISNEYLSPVKLPQLPVHYCKKLAKRLNSILEPYARKDEKIFTQETNEMVRDCFFQFFVSILQNYKKFMDFNANHENSSNFDESGFIKEAPENSRAFSSRFFKTQMFANFCETRLRPQNIEEHSENLLFDEHIFAKLNRSKLRYSKFPTPFINDISQAWKSTWKVPEIVPLPEHKKITYYRFPEILLETIKEYPLPKEKPPKYSESIDFPYSNQVESSQNCSSSREIILFCWINMWAACLWYQEEIEHSLRFKELINALRELKRVSTFSLTSLYKILLEAAARVNPSLGMPIFKEMTDSQVMVDAATVHLLQRILSLSIKKDQKHASRVTGNSIFFTNSSISDNSAPNIYRRRVFTKAGDSHIFAKQELCFLIKETCEKCKRFLNVKEIQEGWQHTPYNFEAFCIYCKEKFIPNLRIRIGLEVGHEHKTSNKENTMFVCPVALKALVCDLLSDANYKFRLDIELFRIYSANIFWNLIWHFNDCGLPFEFMLPYEQEVFNVQSSFVIVGEEVMVKHKVDKEVQTDWNLANIELAMQRYKNSQILNND